MRTCLKDKCRCAIFQGMGGFLKIEHCERSPTRIILEFFLLDTLRNPKMDTIRNFFPKS